MTPAETMGQGCALLSVVLDPHGWRLVVGPTGSGGSGGPSAEAEFVRDDRRLELHFRYSLGLVTYHLADLSLSHADYMAGLQGRLGSAEYPGFSTDPLDGFRHLAADLQQRCGDFISGDGDEFRVCVERARRSGQLSGFKRFASHDV